MQAYAGKFEELQAQVLGISCDTIPSHRAFAKDCGGLDFPLLSDFWPHGEVARSLGVFLEDKGHPRRSVFVLDREGMIRWAYHADLDEQRDVNQILAALEAIKQG